MTEKQVEHRVSFLQYFNSAMITLVCAFSIMTATMVSGLRTDQRAIELKVTEIKTNQVSVMSDVAELKKNAATDKDALAVGLDNIQTWVETWFARK